MKSSRGRRLAFVLPVVLLLMTLAPAVQAAPLAPEWSGQAAATIGTNSCQGISACTGLQGDVGNNSCNGILACYDQHGNVGNDSCGGFHSCTTHTGNVGNGSCNGSNNCDQANANIGNLSCNGVSRSCTFASGNIGNFSCNGIEVCIEAASDVGDCQFNTVTPAACVQPDARVRRIGKHNMVGNDIYNTDGTNQTLSDTLGDRRVRFLITIQNDGLVADSFTVGASTGVFLIPGPAVRFYHGWPAEDISSAVWTSSYTTPTIAPGGVYRIRAAVLPSQVNFSRLAAGPGVPHYSWLVTATSVGNPTKADAVRFEVNVPLN